MTGGHDKITVNGGISGVSGNRVIISGDVQTFTGTNKTFNAGNDTITLKGNVAYAKIYGDAKTVSGTGNTITGGSDTLELGTAATGTIRSVSNSYIDLGHGDDKLTAYSALKNTTLLTQTGKDNITVSTLSNSTVDAGAGADAIKVTNIQGTNNKILSGPDSALDTLTLDSAIKTTNGQNVAVNINNNGTVQDTLFLSNGIATGGNVSIASTNGGLLVAKSGSTSAGYTGFTMSGGSLTGGYAADDVRISTMSGGNVKLGGGEDSLSITTLSNGTIDGGTGDDRIVVNNITGGTISGGNNNDTILVKNFAGTLDGGTGANDTLKLNTALKNGLNLEALLDAGTIRRFENFSFTEVAAGGNLTGTGVRDNINITDMTGGALNTASGNDFINVTTLSGGKVQGGSHIDTIKVTSVKGTGSVIDTGGAADTFLDTVTLVNAIKTTDGKAVTANITNGGSTQDTLFLGGGIAAGGKVALTSTNGGFTVAKSGNDSAGYVGFNMSGGNLTGSAANDEVHINALSGGNVHLSAGNDYLSVNDIKGTLVGGSGTDTLHQNITINTATQLSTYSSKVTAFEIFSFNGMTDGSLTGTDGDDHITIKNMYGGEIKAFREPYLDGNDVIYVKTLHNGTINGGADDDTITVDTMYDGTINSGYGKNTIKIGTLHDGTVNGSASDDTITVDIMHGGIINSDTGGDSINIGIMHAGTVNGSASDDTITVDIMHGGIINSDTGGEIVGSSTSSEEIKINTLNTGKIDLGGNYNELTIDTMKDGEIISGIIPVDGSFSSNVITIATMDNGSITATGESSSITITTMNNGTVQMNTEYNTGLEDINITTMHGGSVSGANRITINSMTDGTVVTSEDWAIISIGSLENGSIVGSMSGGSVQGASIGGNTMHVCITGAGGTLTGSSNFADSFHIYGAAGSSITITDLQNETNNNVYVNDSYNIATEIYNAKEDGYTSYTHDGVTIHFG